LRRKARKTRLWPDRHVVGIEGDPEPFHEFQDRAFDSVARFLFVFAGTQGGKTSFGPWWLEREIRTCGRGDYIAATASFDLFKLKMLPEMRRVFEEILGIGRFWSGMKVIEICDPKTGRFLADRADDMMWARIILRSAQSGGGLEATTANAAWLDECGMDDFTIDNWEAVNRRLSLHKGRALGTTTLYNRGWTKSQIYDPWKKGDEDIEVIQFPSFANPAFPKDEYDRMASILPKWKLNMFYRGEFDIPEGLIYGNFDTDRNVIDPFPIPDDWLKFAGHDFGGVNMAGLLYAESPETKQLFLIDEYLEGHKTTKQHADIFREWKPKLAVGGAWSEDQERLEFGSAGYPIIKPQTKSVEVGIDRVYAQHATDGIMVFRTCSHYLDEKGSYSREVDRDGNPVEKIRDKSSYHLMDSERYIVGTIRAVHSKMKVRRLG
jgi:hypothetical protein